METGLLDEKLLTVIWLVVRKKLAFVYTEVVGSNWSAGVKVSKSK